MKRIRRHTTLIALAALAAGCGGGTDYVAYDPDKPAARDAAAGARGKAVRITVTSPMRFVDASWRSGTRRGRGRLVGRSGADRKGLHRFTFALPAAARGRSAVVGLRGEMPLSATHELRLPAGTRRMSATLGPQDGRCSPARPAACAPPPPDPARYDDTTTAFVSEAGDDEADGSREAPFRTIGRALASEGRSVVSVAAGTYPVVQDRTQRSTAVRVEGAGIGRTRIEGVELTGSGVHLRGVTLVRPLRIGVDKQPAEDVSIEDSELTVPGDFCVRVVQSSARVTIRSSWIHDCNTGMKGLYNGIEDNPVTRTVRLQGNLMERFVTDGVQFADWHDVLITRNLIREIQAGEREDHNDAVQLAGGSENVRIVANEMHGSKHQLILLKDDLGGPAQDVLVENNLLWDAGSWAINNFGLERVRIVNNTAWGNKAGGLVLGKPYLGLPPATDTLVANNLFDQMFVADGAAASLQTGNVYRQVSTGPQEGEVELAKPGFGPSAAPGAYALSARAPARERANRRYLPRTDMWGLPRGDMLTPGALR